MSASDTTAAGAHEAAARVAVAMLARSPRAVGKTRLTAGLDAAPAEALRQALLLDAIEAAIAPGWPLHLFIDPASDVRPVRTIVDADVALADRATAIEFHTQSAGDLGARMTDAMARTLASGCDVVVLVGSDAPDVPLGCFQEAVRLAGPAGERRGRRRLVLGPAEDGGFYLVAARHAESQAFDGVIWSRASVLADVVARAQAVGLDVVLGAPWRDVDTRDDLHVLVARSAGATRTRTVADALPPPYNRG